ncbi:hypothetical protein PHISCL_06971 [Aspergillus sclerotialis]|uniref:Uncharacterized protein n=1 Tax=Aspergillus sclerotialis TaxID=2070753 RepID=A0A3A2ZC57_9EURO|nr:hypothetical protein PHISCL_06971 [Aspergillus sclerotialis]
MLPNTRGSKCENRVASRWYKEVCWMLAHIETLTAPQFSDSDLHILGIHISDLDLEEQNPEPSSTLDTQFFEPIAESKLPISSCASSDFHTVLPARRWHKKFNKKKDPHFLGRQLRNVIFMHEYGLEMKVPSTWKSIDYNTEYTEAAKWSTDYNDSPWHVFNASTPVNNHQPHLILRVMFNCAGDNNLTRSELIVLLNFIQLAIKHQISAHKSRLGKGEGNNALIRKQLLMVSILNPAQARILQAYYDGMLKIRRSKLYDFDNPCHREMMDLFMRWIRSRPCGNTGLKGTLTTIPESPEGEAIVVASVKRG